jgi:predicted Na+-dependent transporter
VVVYAALVPGPPTPETAVGVLLAVTVPTTVAYELARRVQ